jgi:protein-tyrosine-phosphatase
MADDPMTTEVQQTLQHLRIPAPANSARNLTPELAAQAEFIFCMTELQRQAVVKGFSEWASKAFCLQPGIDLEDPHGLGAEGFVQLGQKVQQLVQPLVNRLVTPAEEPESA